DRVLAVEPITYTYKNQPDQRVIGLSAQEIHGLFPEAVDINDDTDEQPGIHSLNYDELIPVLIKAIQEHQAQINTLKQQLEDHLSD
ncbi:MAG: tail fiber domain-containing protein, partial [Bacteroidota bacterium]